MFLIGAMAYGVMTTGTMSAVVTLVMSVAIVFLARTFHDKVAVRYAYLSGCTLMLAGMVWPYVLPFLFVFLFFLIKPLESFSFRNVMAMILGVLTPLWLYLPYWLYVHFRAADWSLLYAYYKHVLWSVDFFDYTVLMPLEPIVYGLLMLLFLILTVHKSSYRFRGRLFVRSQRSMYIGMTWTLAIALLFVPSFSGYLLPLMAACIGPIAAQVAIGNDR